MQTVGWSLHSLSLQQAAELAEKKVATSKLKLERVRTAYCSKNGVAIEARWPSQPRSGLFAPPARLVGRAVVAGGGGVVRARRRGAGPDQRHGQEEPHLHRHGAGRLLWRRRACQLQRAAGGPARQGLRRRRRYGGTCW